MYLNLKAEPVDLKDFVGKAVFLVGQGNAWDRGSTFEENIKEFSVESCAVKYAKLVEVTDGKYKATIEIERKDNGHSSHHGIKNGCNSSYLVFASKQKIEDYLKATRAASHLGRPHTIPVEALLEIYAILKKHNLIKE